jgi:hypothetical protein
MFGKSDKFAFEKKLFGKGRRFFLSFRKGI